MGKFRLCYNKAKGGVLEASKKRVSILGLMKFLCSIIIMHYHFYATGTNHHFGSGSILVEFFFMITGYFTYSHFCKIKRMPKSYDVKAKNGIIYTFLKLKNLYLYIVIGIILGAGASMIGAKSISDIFVSIRSVLAELFLLTPLFDYQQTAVNGVTWFLASLAIMLPLFVMVIQTKARNVLMIAFTILSLALLSFRLNGTSFFCGIGRCAMCLMFGALIYELARKLEACKLSKSKTVILSIVELLLIVGQFAAIFFSKSTSLSADKMVNYVSIVLIFFLNLTILLSGKTFFSNMHIRLFDYLEKISMVIYLLHVPFVITLNRLGLRGHLKATLLFEAIVIVCSMLFFAIVSALQKNAKNKPSKSRR